MDKFFEKYKDLDKAYHFDNFKIINTGKSKISYVFIQGNIINPRKGTFDFYEKNKENFEWMKVANSPLVKNNSGKIIFIRDFASKFYLYGINHKITSIDDVVEFIKKETDGYDVYFAGYSGGAYLSLILGSMLKNTKRIYAFGPIYNLLLWDGIDHSYSQEDLDYFRLCKDKTRSKYFNIAEYINGLEQKVLSFYGKKCEADLVQQNFINNSGLIVPTLAINTERHCGNLSFYTLVGLLSCNNKKFLKIQKLSKHKTVKEIKILLMVNPRKILNYAKYRFNKNLKVRKSNG